MNTIDFQIVSQSETIPEQQKFQLWVDAALNAWADDYELLIRIVDEPEMTQFNQQYRNKTGPTNILSFPFEIPLGMESPLLGDLLVCAPVLEMEALQQHKPIDHHWAHIIIHGVLHLLGYDHIDDDEAEEMEALEISILKTINIKNPYQESGEK